MNISGNIFVPILDRTTISNVASECMFFGASVMMFFTISMPALIGGLDSMQLNFSVFTGSYKWPHCVLALVMLFFSMFFFVKLIARVLISVM